MKIKGIFIICVILAVGLGLVAIPMSTAGIRAPTDFFEITVQGEDARKPEYVQVVDERLDLTTLPPKVNFKDRSVAKPDRWYILGTKIKNSNSRAYLAYNPSGKDTRIYLSREAGPGTDWQFGKREKGERDLLMAIPQAVSGKVKGWYLGVEEYEDTNMRSTRVGSSSLSHRRALGQPKTAFRLVLCKDRKKTEVIVFRLDAYRSTAR